MPEAILHESEGDIEKCFMSRLIYFHKKASAWEWNILTYHFEKCNSGFIVKHMKQARHYQR